MVRRPATLRPGHPLVRSLLLLAPLTGCADSLPDDIADYANRCQKMNRTPLPERSDDPHRGEKNVYACGVSDEALQQNTRPFPDGTLIVKESTRSDSSFPWLVATAEKRNGSWAWNEYSRNFETEPYLAILATESVCTDCHRRVKSADWIYTLFEASVE